MESHLGLILEQIWEIYIDPLIIIIMASSRDYCLGTNWYLLMVKCMALIKASN